MTAREDDLEFAMADAMNSIAADAALLEELAQDVTLGEFRTRGDASLEEILLGCANNLKALRTELAAELKGGE